MKATACNRSQVAQRGGQSHFRALRRETRDSPRERLPTASPRRRSAGKVAMAMGVFVLAAAGPLRAADLAVWELMPYRIQVAYAVDRVPTLPEVLVEQLTQDLLSRIDAYIGAAWQVRVFPAHDSLRQHILDRLGELTAEQIPEPMRTSDETDKIILLGVSALDSGAVHVAARELDVRTQQFGPVVERKVWHSGLLADAAFHVVFDAFAPLGQIVASDPKTKEVTIRLRAGALPTRDPQCALLEKHIVFQTVVRYNDRYGKPRRILAIPWTFLVVEQQDTGPVRCTLHTGLRSPLSGRRRGAVEQLALGVRPSRRSSRLVLHDERTPEQPLVGYHVYSHPPGSKTTELLGMTDPEGAVVVPPAAEPLRILLVKHGDRFLARLPMVPGAEAEYRVPIANDDQRLAAESFVAKLQDELVDLVTRREILIARIRHRLEQRETEKATELLDTLRRLPDRNDFRRSLLLSKKRLVSPDPAVQARIDQMFAKTEQLVAFYLDPAPIDEVIELVRQAGRGSPGL